MQLNTSHVLTHPDPAGALQRIDADPHCTDGESKARDLLSSPANGPGCQRDARVWGSVGETQHRTRGLGPMGFPREEAEPQAW